MTAYVLLLTLRHVVFFLPHRRNSCCDCYTGSDNQKEVSITARHISCIFQVRLREIYPCADIYPQTNNSKQGLYKYGYARVLPLWS